MFIDFFLKQKLHVTAMNVDICKLLSTEPSELWFFDKFTQPFDSNSDSTYNVFRSFLVVFLHEIIIIIFINIFPHSLVEAWCQMCVKMFQISSELVFEMSFWNEKNEFIWTSFSYLLHHVFFHSFVIFLNFIVIEIWFVLLNCSLHCVSISPLIGIE